MNENPEEFIPVKYSGTYEDAHRICWKLNFWNTTDPEEHGDENARAYDTWRYELYSDVGDKGYRWRLHHVGWLERLHYDGWGRPPSVDEIMLDYTTRINAVAFGMICYLDPTAITPESAKP